MLPEIFKIGTFTLSGYRFFYITGIVFAVIVVLILSRKEKFDFVETINYLIFGIVAGLAGAKLYGVIVQLFSSPERCISDRSQERVGLKFKKRVTKKHQFRQVPLHLQRQGDCLSNILSILSDLFLKEGLATKISCSVQQLGLL